MDIWRLLNIKMGIRAGECCQQHKDEACPNVAMANKSLTVWIDKEKLACFGKQVLCNKAFARTGKTDKDKSTWTCKDFWKEREKIPEAAVEHIHWEALKKALANSPQGKQWRIPKHWTGQCGVGQMLQRRKHQEHSLCPRCGEADKTTKHVIQCQAADTRQRRKTEIKTLRQWFVTTATKPELQYAIFQRLEEWHDNKPHRPMHITNRLLREAVQQQDLIGWWSSLQGQISQKFERIMEEHYKQILTRKKHNKWTRTLIQQIWELQRQLWEHRNNVEHTQMTPAKQQQLDIMMARARDELQVGCTDVQCQDCYLFAKPESKLSMTLTDLALWLKEVQLARRTVDDVRIRKREQVARSCAVMHAWLSSHNPTTSSNNTCTATTATTVTADSHAEQ